MKDISIRVYLCKKSLIVENESKINCFYQLDGNTIMVEYAIWLYSLKLFSTLLCLFFLIVIFIRCVCLQCKKIEKPISNLTVGV